MLWALALGRGQVLIRRERGHRALFLLPALLFTVAMVIFPTVFGLYIASTDWNLSSLTGVHFNVVGNFASMLHDAFFWTALGNMVWYVLSVLVQYAIAFGLALLLNAEIRARKFFRVVFLLPFMLSPGRGELDDRQVDHGIPLRPGGHARPHARLGDAGLLRRPPGWRAPASWRWIPGCGFPS